VVLFATLRRCISEVAADLSVVSMTGCRAMIVLDSSYSVSQLL
jgi:hypothetical protein